jgi:integrase
MRKRLTKMTLEMRLPETGRLEIRDSDSPLIYRLSAQGGRTFCVRVRVGGLGQPQRFTFPRHARIDTLAEARQWAYQTVEACRTGQDPRATGAATDAAAALEAERLERLKCKHVIKDYLERRVRREKKNRTADEMERSFNIYVLPRWGETPITQIDRKDVNDLLDDIFDREVKFEGQTFGGNVAADNMLARLRACFNWYALKDSKFVSPIVQGMARTKPRERLRRRVLSDLEIRVMWPILPTHGVFGAIVKELLLSAQRRDEVADMLHTEIAPDGIWTIPASRYKGKRDHTVPLSKAALAVIAEQHQIDGSDFVFTTTGETAFSGFSKCKARLDKALLAALKQDAEERGEDPTKVELPNWRLHDLRRTAKTLMIRAGVRPDLSERVLGHVISGVEGIYDQHDYIAEKRAALEALASLLKRIINPPAANVVRFREAAE